MGYNVARRKAVAEVHNHGLALMRSLACLEPRIRQIISKRSRGKRILRTHLQLIGIANSVPHNSEEIIKEARSRIEISIMNKGIIQVKTPATTTSALGDISKISVTDYLTVIIWYKIIKEIRGTATPRSRLIDRWQIFSIRWKILILISVSGSRIPYKNKISETRIPGAPSGKPIKGSIKLLQTIFGYNSRSEIGENRLSIGLLSLVQPTCGLMILILILMLFCAPMPTTTHGLKILKELKSEWVFSSMKMGPFLTNSTATSNHWRTYTISKRLRRPKFLWLNLKFAVSRLTCFSVPSGRWLKTFWILKTRSPKSHSTLSRDSNVHCFLRRLLAPSKLDRIHLVMVRLANMITWNPEAYLYFGKLWNCLSTSRSKRAYTEGISASSTAWLFK